MLSCWQEEAGKRPSFANLKTKFNNILLSQGSSEYVDFTVNPKEAYYTTEEDDVSMLTMNAPPSILLSPATDRNLRALNRNSCVSPSLSNTESLQKQSGALKPISNPVALSTEELRGLSKERQIPKGHCSSKIVAKSHSQELIPGSAQMGPDRSGEEEDNGRYVRDPMLLSPGCVKYGSSPEMAGAANMSGNGEAERFS